jgi:hypothetical protein
MSTELKTALDDEDLMRLAHALENNLVFPGKQKLGGREIRRLKAAVDAARAETERIREALRVAWTYAASPIEHCKKSPSSSGWMVEQASKDEDLIREALATHRPRRAAITPGETNGR